MADFATFELERYQSRWEHQVRYNLAESGVHPLSIGELLELSGTETRALHDCRLIYSQSNGTPELRGAIAELYPGATPDNVLVTVGSSEANFAVGWSTMQRGDHVAVQLPTYMQMWGLAKNLGANVRPFHLHLDGSWALDLDEFRRAVQPDTAVVVLTNPNNPTGHILADETRGEIIDRVSQCGAWLVVDEVYRGAERTGGMTPSFWGSTPRTIVTGGLSKAYGLPGLRIGWIVAPTDFIHEAMKRHDYIVIGPSAVSDFLATRGLAVGDRLLARTRAILEQNYPLLETWLRGFGETFSWAPPDAGAITYVHYDLGIDSFALVERLRTHAGTLLVPGAHFNMGKFVRIGFGEEKQVLTAALSAVETELRNLIPD